MTSPHRKQNIQFKKLKLVNIVKMIDPSVNLLRLTQYKTRYLNMSRM